jgi:import inner membrane translocase subunit TIM21
LQVGIAARFLSSASGEQPNQRQQQQQQPAKGAEPAKATEEAAFDSLELTDEKINAITDKIPQRPVGAVEATSYSAVIAAAFACLAYFVYNLFTTLVLEPVPQRCFNAALERLRGDPRVTVRVGSPVTGFGQDSANRTARHVIPHSLYRDAEGREHCRLQFHIRGPGGSGVVSADMYRGGSEAAADSTSSSGSGSAFGGDSGGGSGSGRDGEWRYLYLVVDVAQPGGGAPQRVNIVMPR